MRLVSVRRAVFFTHWRHAWTACAAGSAAVNARDGATFAPCLPRQRRASRRRRRKWRHSREWDVGATDRACGALPAEQCPPAAPGRGRCLRKRGGPRCAARAARAGGHVWVLRCHFFWVCVAAGGCGCGRRSYRGPTTSCAAAAGWPRVTAAAPAWWPAKKFPATILCNELPPLTRGAGCGAPPSPPSPLTVASPHRTAHAHGAGRGNGEDTYTRGA